MSGRPSALPDRDSRGCRTSLATLPALPRLSARPRRCNALELGDERLVDAGAPACIYVEPRAARTRGAERRMHVRVVRGPRVGLACEPAQPHPAEVHVADLVGVDLLEHVGGR